MIARAVVTSPAANLPLLPTPKPLQTEKRARNAELIDTHKGSRVIVLNLPHETQFKDVTRLFDPYSVYVMFTVSSRLRNISILFFG